MLWLLLACAEEWQLPEGDWPAEVCDDFLDNDQDGDIDCRDADCHLVPHCEDRLLEDCTDGIDNDSNGDVDCYDADCETSSACREICDDGLDNDVDGLVGCEGSFQIDPLLTEPWIFGP